MASSRSSALAISAHLDCLPERIELGGAALDALAREVLFVGLGEIEDFLGLEPLSGEGIGGLFLFALRLVAEGVGPIPVEVGEPLLSRGQGSLPGRNPANNLSVYFSSMTNAYDKNDKPRVHELGDDPIIADPITPEIGEAPPFQRLTDGAGIVEARESFMYESENALPHRLIEPVKIVDHIRGVLNRPGYL